MLRDPKLALAIAIHEGAMRLVAEGMSEQVAIKISTGAMKRIVGEGMDTSLSSIEDEFVNSRL